MAAHAEAVCARADQGLARVRPGRDVCVLVPATAARPVFAFEHAGRGLAGLRHEPG